ncbi:unnamed protein product [Calypogeia fissa]
MVGNDLAKHEANYGALTPITFLQRAAAVYPERASVIYGRRRFTWAMTLERCRRLASALQFHNIAPGDTVGIVAPNVPAMYEVHFGVPMAGAVLSAINIRLDARTIAVILAHAEIKLILVDTEFLPLVKNALHLLSEAHPTHAQPFVVHIADNSSENPSGIRSENLDLGQIFEYEDFIGRGDPNFNIRLPEDEWEAISINYTSGTTAAPKGVVYHHRGAYLNALAAALDWDMTTGPVFLWTVPMFHCNGWCFTWTLAAMGGTNICMRNVNLKVKNIYDTLIEHKVTHMSGAPIVLNMLANAKDDEWGPLPWTLQLWTGGAPPPPATFAKLEKLGVRVGHGYGTTETYGPSISCARKPEWEALSLDERSKLMTRQGVGHLAVAAWGVFDPETMVPVPRDGKTMGEVMVKGHTIMKGYLKDQQATEDAFRGGFYHTGDLAVMHGDGYIEVKDRSKDIIISGGENISSIEVESILFQHPQILEAAVVARPDDYWGETPCAFVTLKESTIVQDEDCETTASEKDIIQFCRARLPHYMCPRSVVFASLPKNATGKVQKNELRQRAKLLGSIFASTKQMAIRTKPMAASKL